MAYDTYPMYSYEFPPYPCLEDETKFKPRFPKNSRPVYVGSLHKEFVKRIVSVKCSGTTCDKSLIGEESSPMTGYCGHLFCSGCATALVAKYNTERKRDTETGSYTPHDMSDEVTKEVYFSTSYMRHPLYSCKSCPDGENAMPRKEELDRNVGYLKLFSANRMVENLYKALKKGKGFPCCHPGCEEWHPQYNSLWCTMCSLDTNFKHVCMSHAKEHLKHIIIPDPPRYPQFRPTVPPSGTRLSSVDRTDLRVIASFFHCAHCRKRLEEVNKDKKYTRSRHLQCGHFVGSECVKEVLTEAQSNFVVCFFCNEKFQVDEGKAHFLFPSEQLGDIIQNTPHSLAKCKTGKCGGGRLHPRDTIVAKDCEWCAAENELSWVKFAVESNAILSNPAHMNALGLPSRK